jgi:hypothetical protein
MVANYLKMLLATDALREKAILTAVKNIQSMKVTGRGAVHCLSELYVAISSSASSVAPTLSSHFLRELCDTIINPALIQRKGNNDAHSDDSGDADLRCGFSNGVAQCFDLIACIFRASVMSSSATFEVRQGDCGDGEYRSNDAGGVLLTRQVVDKLISESWEVRFNTQRISHSLIGTPHMSHLTGCTTCYPHHCKIIGF